MSDPFVGEIRMFGGSFPPNGWAFCNGAPMAISENDVLFQLIGTTYGGDGQSTFNLPNLQSRVPVHQGTNTFGTTYQMGEQGGVEQVTLNSNQIPAHNHALMANSALASSPDPAGAVLAQSRAAGIDSYLEDVPTVSMATQAVSTTGGSQPHDNLQPYLCVSYIISLYGIFPSQN